MVNRMPQHKLFNVFYAYPEDAKHPQGPLDGVSNWHGYADSVPRDEADELVEHLLKHGYQTLIESSMTQTGG